MKLPGDITMMSYSLEAIALCSVVALLRSLGVLRWKKKGE